MKAHLAAAAVLTAVASLSLASTAMAAAPDTLVGSAQRTTAPTRHAPAPAPKAGTAVTLGEISTPGGPSCGLVGTTVQASSSGPSFTTPGAGVIVSYSVYANANPGSVRLNVFTPGPAVGHFTQVGKSALTPVTVSSVNTFPVRVPVPAGALLGASNSASNMDCGRLVGTASDVIGFGSPFNPDTETDLNPVGFLSSARANISAVWEPDVDGDGFGDVSQDACPQSKTTQVTCPAPDTTVKKPRLLASGKVKITFKSTIAGSTFTCAIDGKKAKACKSPLTKRYSFGKHKIVVTAISPQGIADPTPFKGKFRLFRR